MHISIIFVVFLLGSAVAAPAQDSKFRDIEEALKSLIRERTLHSPSKSPNKIKVASNEPPEEQESPNTLESDMRLTTDQLELVKDSMTEAPRDVHSRTLRISSLQKRKAILAVKYRWPQAIVPYVLDPSLGTTYEGGILKAMKHIEDRTCIRFKPYSASLASKLQHDVKVRIHRGSGCYSDVGKRDAGDQELSIGNGCNVLGTVVHEMMHTLGFYHEQSRPDRDDYIRVHKEKIDASNLYNFNKYGHDEVTSLGVPYDYGSLMHYKGTYFAKEPGAITMETVDPNMQSRIGQRAGMSFIDVMTINEMYNCNQHCTNTHLVCENQGFVGPNCACVCPDGLSGEKCTEVEPTASPCGDVFTDMSGTITSPNYPNPYGENRDCNWLIQGAPGATITVRFDDFDIEDDPKCSWDYLEVRSRGPHHAGPRYCGSGPQRPVVYNDTSLILQLHSDDDYSTKGFKLTYTISTTSRVDGQWSDWQPWTKCSKTCGVAYKLRVRYCTNPAPANGGRECEGDDIEFATCGLPAC